MDLFTAFERALPARDWAREARTGVLVALVESHAWSPWMADALALIDAPERARVERQRRPHDRETLAVAYACHRLLLGAALRIPPVHVRLGRDALGCPRLADGAAQTSLGHAQGWIAVAISTLGPVGVDIEPVTRAPELPEIAERVCHPAEAAALTGLPMHERAAALLALWVRKEAFLKAEGIGLAREMADFSAADGSVLPLSSVPGRQVRIRMIEAGPHCIAAVAGPPQAPVQTGWICPTR